MGLPYRGGWLSLAEGTALSLACPAAPHRSSCLWLCFQLTAPERSPGNAGQSTQPAAALAGLGSSRQHKSPDSPSWQQAGAELRLGTSAALLLELQPAPGAAEPEEPRGGPWGELGERGAPSQGWRVAPRGRVEQVRFRFLRAGVCCAFVVTMTALLGRSTVLGRLLLFLLQPGKGSPGGGCDLVRSPWRGQELRRRLHRSCGVVEEQGDGSVLSSPGTFPFLQFPMKVRMFPGCLLPWGGY